VYEYRLYIDESGDHNYKHAINIENRYLGLTGVLIEKHHYDKVFQPHLEDIKRAYFSYDIDNPPILVRKAIIKRSGVFCVLLNADVNKKWEESILNYFASLAPYSQIFTVVIDKQAHHNKYSTQSYNSYDYSLKVLLRRVRGYLAKQSKCSDVIAESRGPKEDGQIREAYCSLRLKGDKWGKGTDYQSVFPDEELKVKRKSNNVVGLQIADLIAAGQKLAIIQKHNKPLPSEMSQFTEGVNSIIKPIINDFGQYLLE